MELKLIMCIRQEREPHSPIQSSPFTQAVLHLNPNLDLENILTIEADPEVRAFSVERRLLSNWSYKNLWKTYLDAPLIVHADAALQLKEKGYDTIVGIKKAGTAYSEIFGMMGFPVYDVDYSHHRRSMDMPVMDEYQLSKIKNKSVLLVDVDIVTGKTLRTVVDYLNKNAVNVSGIYVGLSEWPGMDLEEPRLGYDIGKNTIDLGKFWRINKSGLCQVNPRAVNLIARVGILPPNFQIYGPNSNLEEKECHFYAAAKRVARALH